jgi:adenylate cyclase
MARGDGRRLGAIMLTDIVGFTSAAQSNEKLALKLLDEHRQLLRPVFSRHGGWVVKTIGDAFLVEFSSAVKAVECAVEVQRRMMDWNLAQLPGDRLTVRIGVHVGEVVEVEKDIYGDAVNIASRVVKLAEPGGICVTQHVRDLIANKVDLKLERFEGQQMKNVLLPIEVYRVVVPWLPSAKGDSGNPQRTRLAVLPLRNVSPDPTDEYFAEGLTDELISTLSKISGLNVISRTSVAKYKGTPKTVGEIARDLRAGSIVEGSVRKSGDRIRISVQLVDPENDQHLWSETYDRQVGDVFAIQSDIAKQVAESLKVELLKPEERRIAKKETLSDAAYVAYLKGRVLLHDRTEGAIKGAREQFELAIREDPKYAKAYAGLADTHLLLGDYLFAPYPESISTAMSLVRKALELDPDVAEAHVSLANILMYDYRFGEAENEFRLGISLNPSYASGHHWYSVCLRHFGRYDEAFRELKLAEELDPLSSAILLSSIYAMSSRGLEDEVNERLDRLERIDQSSPLVAEAHMAVHFRRREWEKARFYLRKMREMDPTDPYLDANEGYIHAVLGEREEAHSCIEKLKAVPENAGIKGTLLAFVYAGLGELDECFTWLDFAFEMKEQFISFFRTFPLFREVRSDPRFNKILERARLPPLTPTELAP